MKIKILFFTFILIPVLSILSFIYPSELLLAPEKLAAIIQDKNAVKPIIINVGPSGMIKGSVYIGNAEDPSNKEKLKNYLKTIPKSKEVVLYCGCCKLEDCWNIQEAHKVLQSSGNTNYKILNMPTDFGTDWHSKGFPVE